MVCTAHLQTWIGPENGNGVLKTIEGTYEESTNTITVPTMPGSKDELQNTVNGSAESGVKVEITGGGNIDIDSTVSVPGGADVAIKPGNGDTVTINADGDTTAFNVSGGKLTLGGDGGTVTVDGGETDTLNGSSSLITVGTGGTLNITTGATIRNNRLSGGDGGGIRVNGGTVEMTGGNITNCQGVNFGGGVYITSGIFNMSGGTIDHCFATYQSKYTWGGGGVNVRNPGIFNLSGTAVISDNSARLGGGVYVDGGTFNMKGGKILRNVAEGNKDDGNWGGGGVFVTGAGSFTLTGGTISDNNVSGSVTTGGGISINGTPTFECEVSKIGADIIIQGNTHKSAQDQINMKAGVKLAITKNGSPKSLSSRIQILEDTDVKTGLENAYNATP